jgi:pimeloyl-ACP methyl ester carboxylesterase
MGALTVEVLYRVYAGNGGPPAVLYVHGAGGFVAVPLVEHLAGCYRVVTAELLGVGSTRAGTATSMRELGQLLAGAITSLGIHGCAWWWGPPWRGQP